MRDDDGKFAQGNRYATGRIRLPAEFKKIRRLSPRFVELIISKLAGMTPQELMAYVESGSLTTLESMFASIFMRAVEHGDHNRGEFLLNRSIGRVVENKHVVLEAVTYKTSVDGDGALVQEVIKGELDGDGEPFTIDFEEATLDE